MAIELKAERVENAALKQRLREMENQMMSQTQGPGAASQEPQSPPQRVNTSLLDALTDDDDDEDLETEVMSYEQCLAYLGVDETEAEQASREA